MLILASWLLSSSAWATRPKVVCSKIFPDRCSVGLSPGQVTPIEGTLLSPELALAIGQKADQADARCQAELTRTSSKAEARRLRDVQYVQADLHAVTVERDAYKEVATVSWYEHPLFVAVTTAAVVIAIDHFGND